MGRLHTITPDTKVFVGPHPVEQARQRRRVDLDAVAIEREVRDAIEKGRYGPAIPRWARLYGRLNKGGRLLAGQIVVWNEDLTVCWPVTKQATGDGCRYIVATTMVRTAP